MVMTSGGQGRTRGKIKIGAAHPSLTAAGGMLAVTELCGKLGLIEALDEAMGPVKQRRAGVYRRAGAGRDSRRPAGRGALPGVAGPGARRSGGQQVTPVPGLATSTAAGIARRFTGKHWRGTEAELAAATARMAALLPAERATEFAVGR